ncbi:MAG TPA: hypothetical protein VEI97_02440 [bacterium]|nr:hypothetical protein [bacterium]
MLHRHSSQARDTRDCFLSSLDAGQNYALEIETSNGRWGSWAVTVDVRDPDRRSVAGGTFESATARIEIGPQFPGNYAIQIAGTPLAGARDGIDFLEYTVRLVAAPLQQMTPAILGITPSGTIEQFGKDVVFSAVATSDPDSCSGSSGSTRPHPRRPRPHHPYGSHGLGRT